eukprot:4566327-Alexandrium_andersonii.AAC.1
MDGPTQGGDPPYSGEKQVEHRWGRGARGVKRGAPLARPTRPLEQSASMQLGHTSPRLTLRATPPARRWFRPGAGSASG